MIDHVLGRPSTRFRKYQVFTVVLLWSIYLRVGPRHGPWPIEKLSKWVSKRFSVHQSFIAFCVSLYVSRNFARVVGLESPEPLANLYTRDYFRATWATTALDAGFWTAMHLKPMWLRHICSIVFSVYYLVCAEQADEMVRRVRGGITVQHMRVSWDKAQTPILRFATALQRPWALQKIKPFPVTIPRPAQSDYKLPIKAWMYFDGPISELKQHDKIVLDIPGGGFVAMNPRCHDDKLLGWASKLGIPVLALDYRKAPEDPYPYALNECYDAYFQIITTRGRCIGLSGDFTPKIIISGDSAGGNLAVGTVLMLLDNDQPYSTWERRGQSLPLPEAVCAIYPALEMNIGNWMTDEQVALLKQPSRRTQNKRILKQKSEDYNRLTPNTPHASDDEGADEEAVKEVGGDTRPSSPRIPPAPTRSKTNVAVSSMISYVNDRIITPEMLRAMILLYVGPYNKPDFANDFLLSPLRAPEALLAKFPRIFLMCGERDPLVDDTAIFAGRLRQAKFQEFKRRQELGLESESAVFDDRKHVEVLLVERVSHGFMQIAGLYPKGWDYIYACSRWMRERFLELDPQEPPTPMTTVSSAGSDYFTYHRGSNASRRGSAATSGDEKPLEMVPSSLRMTGITTKPSSSHHHHSSTHLHKKLPTKKPRTGSSVGAAAHRRNVQRSIMSGSKSPGHRRLSKLSSTEDLVKRRMLNMTEGLLGDEEAAVDSSYNGDQ